MDRWAGKVAVVTGASSGIGLATAKALVRHGMIVVGLARRVEVMQDRMKEVTGSGEFHPKLCDVSNENQVLSIFEWIEKNLKTVHVLVNNAGNAIKGSIQAMKTEDMLCTINLNIVGLLHYTRQAMKLMNKNDHEAHIVNINSILGHTVPNFPDFNVYPATKFAVTALTKTLMVEVKGSKIRVTSVSPGLVETEIFNNSGVDPAFMKSMPSLKAEDVADFIVHVISAPQHVQITELTIQPLGQLES